jgi:DNA topoisomerase IA
MELVVCGQQLNRGLQRTFEVAGQDLQVEGAGFLTCISYKEEGARKHRPHALNTVELLKVASASLGIGPHQTMAVAERLYIQGFISYPRTESTKYPEAFNFEELLVAQASHPLWGPYVRACLYCSCLHHLLVAGFLKCDCGGLM